MITAAANMHGNQMSQKSSPKTIFFTLSPIAGAGAQGSADDPKATSRRGVRKFYTRQFWRKSLTCRRQPLSTRSGHATSKQKPRRIGCAVLLKQVFGIDIEHCSNCGGELKIIAAILEQPVIEKILTHLGLWAT